VTIATKYEPHAAYSHAGGLSPATTLVLGAVTGLAFGYLFFTDHGRQFRARAEPALETWLRELSRVRDTADKVMLAYAGGREFKERA